MCFLNTGHFPICSFCFGLSPFLFVSIFSCCQKHHNDSNMLMPKLTPRSCLPTTTHRTSPTLLHTIYMCHFYIFVFDIFKTTSPQLLNFASVSSFYITLHWDKQHVTSIFSHTKSHTFLVRQTVTMKKQYTGLKARIKVICFSPFNPFFPISKCNKIIKKKQKKERKRKLVHATKWQIWTMNDSDCQWLVDSKFFF